MRARMIAVLWACVVAGAHAQGSPAPSARAVFSGSVRSRVELWDWFEAPAADGSYAYVGTLVRLGATGRTPRNDWQVELAVPWLANLPTDAQAPPPAGPLGLGANYRTANGGKEANLFLKQGFVRLHNLGSRDNTLRLGRFEFVEGLEGAAKDPTIAALKRDRVAHRLLGNFAWSHVGRSLDGLQFTRNVPGLNLTLVAARPTRGVFDVRGWDELDAEVYYAAATKPLPARAGAGETRLFWLLYADHRDVVKVDNRPAAVRSADQSDLFIHTLGGHLLRVFPLGSGTGDLLLWGAGQLGDWGKQDHRAGALAAEVGYQPKGSALRPWLRGGIDWASGDRDPANGVHGTFFSVLPTPRIYARFPFYNAMNTTDWFLSVMLRPPSRWVLRADYHNLALSRRADLWYQGGGAFQNGPAFGYVGRPSGGSSGLANVVDMSVDYTVSATTSVTFYAAYAAGQGVVDNTYPAGKNASLIYLELNRKL